MQGFELKKTTVFDVQTNVLHALKAAFIGKYTTEYMDSNKDILDRAIGRPAMMAFMLLVGTYVTTGQLIPGIF